MWGAIIAAIAGILTTIISADAQKKENRRMMQAQMDAQLQLLDKQNTYNTPSAQMNRLANAGLNPHLMYGQGSPGNQPTPGSAPSAQVMDYLSVGNSVRNDITQTLPLINQTRLANAQVDAQNASTAHKYAQTEVSRLQAQVIAKNPLLDDAGFKATIDSLTAAAQLKQTQVKSEKIRSQILESSAGHQVAKVFNEVKNLEQRFRLGELDAKLKAEVLKSKEFQNAILEVQKKFMTDAEITPQHILQFVQLLLMKAL